MNRREALGLLLVTAEGAMLPTVALADPVEGHGLKGRIFQWTQHNWSWGGRAKQDLRRVAMRIWVNKPGYDERTEMDFLPEETGTFLASSIRFHGGPKLGGVVHLPGVYEREEAIPYLARMERAMEKSLMYYNLLGTTEDHESVAARIAERFPGTSATWPGYPAFAEACDMWMKENWWA